jgi:hypothetical protein
MTLFFSLQHLKVSTILYTEITFTPFCFCLKFIVTNVNALLCFIEERGLEVNTPIKVPWDLFSKLLLVVIPRL